jgi:hypothetical protein
VSAESILDVKTGRYEAVISGGSLVAGDFNPEWKFVQDP